MARNSVITAERPETDCEASGSNLSFCEPLSAVEKELMQELLLALRTIRFGSVVLTMHDGRLVEIQKTERIRTNGSREKSVHTQHR